MNFVTHAYSNAGGRSNNEDCLMYAGGVWLVADGLGGHDCGEVASKTAADAVKSLVNGSSKQLDNNLMSEIIQTANMAVIDKQKSDKNLESMRTTVVFAATDGSKLKYANVGDSRFYYFRQGKIECISEDHSVSYASVKLGDIAFEDIRNDPDRNKLVKVLGDKENLSVKIPDKEITVQPGDAFLLCSDGFWEYVHETEMETDLAKSLSPKEWVNYMAKRIILRTHNNGNDNFTAIAVMID